MTKNFYRNTDGIIFVFDITNSQSFFNIKYWLNDSEAAPNNFKKILQGNKIDLENERQINKEKMESFGAKKNMKCFEVSAKEGINVDNIFNEIVELILCKKTDEEIKEEFTKKHRALIIPDKSKNKKKGCC